MPFLNKKIVWAFVFAAVIAAGAVFIVFKEKQKLQYENLLAVNEEKKQQVFKDSDNDGLKDWEEELWNTDPSNPDTDNDGTSDYEEIRQERNPLVKGPDDKLDRETIAKKINSQVESDLTETGKFSRELFAKYVAARKTGSIEEGDYQSLLYRYVQKEQEGDNIKIYEDGDFSVINEKSAAIIRNYGNELGKILKKNESKDPENENELIILDNATRNSDEKELEKLDAAINRYKNLTADFLKVKAPADALPIHGEITNLFNILGVSVEGMKLIFKDPIGSLGTVSFYPTAVDNLIKSLENLKNYFLDNGIKFRSNEDGYIITGGV